MEDIVTFTHARQNLSALMDRVTENHEVIAITRGNRPPVVMLSIEDFKGYAETAYLMSTEANRRALTEAIANVKKGKNLIPVEWDDKSQQYVRTDE